MTSISSVLGITFFATLCLLPLVPATAAPDGELIYRESCSVCHGDDGSGAMWGRTSLATPPRNFRSERAKRELTRERMLASVAGGRPGTPMPGFATQLDMSEIGAVVDYVRREFMTPQATQTAEPAALPAHGGGAPVFDHSAPVTPAFSGDVERGRELYAANCVACHGVDGAGDGPRAYFIFPRPRNFLDPAVRVALDRPGVFRGIKFGVIGKEMPAWGKVLTDQQIADIAEFVHGAFIAPSPQPSR